MTSEGLLLLLCVFSMAAMNMNHLIPFDVFFPRFVSFFVFFSCNGKSLDVAKGSCASSNGYLHLLDTFFGIWFLFSMS